MNWKDAKFWFDGERQVLAVENVCADCYDTETCEANCPEGIDMDRRARKEGALRNTDHGHVS